jgi:hypothetical protein
MRKLYNYQVIRYFPNINSDEFFNVGIHLANDEKNILHFINENHLTKIMSFPSIDKKNIDSFIRMLQKEVNISHWYGNNLKFSEKKAFRSSESFEEVLEILYEDYIGYKFHIKEKIDTIEIIKKNTRDIVSKEFKKYLDVNENTIFDFDIIDKSSSRHHYSNLGSMTNRDNIQSMVWDVESFLVVNHSVNGVFELLNIHKPTQDIQVANNILHKSNIVDIPYYDEPTQYEYLKKVANI